MPQKDPEARRQYMRRWREKNPDKVRANDLRRRGKQREYRRAHLPQYAQYQRDRRHRKPQEHLVMCAQTRARRDGLPYDITVENMAWPTHCPVLGIALDYNRTAAGDRKIRNNSPTIDRRVNELGYVVGNAFVISHRANRIKSDATAEELMRVAAYATGA